MRRDPRFSHDRKKFYIDPNCPPHYRPSDELLRDHLRPCVLANLKPLDLASDIRCFDPEIDLGAGSFNLADGSWWSSTEGRSQMEVELAARLHSSVVEQAQFTE